MTLALSILSLLCWGSWASTLKSAGPKWRFELYYFDFAFGILVAALAAAFTFGSMGEELSFADNVLIAGKRQIAYALAAGAVFNLANMLLVAAVSIAGMAVAFPISMGLALIAGTVGSYVVQKTGNAALIFGGAGLVLVAVVLTAMAASSAAPATVTKAPAAPGRNANVKSSTSGGALKGIIVSLISGLLMAGFSPLVALARDGGSELGLGAYAIIVFFSIGVFLSTMIYNLYFINLPIHGEAIELGGYLRGSMGQHLLGILGGILWCAGTLSNFVVSAVAGAAKVGPALSFGLAQGAPVISALWGLLIWREFKAAGGRATTLVMLMLLVFVAGLALIAFGTVPPAAAIAAP